MVVSLLSRSPGRGHRPCMKVPAELGLQEKGDFPGSRRAALLPSSDPLLSSVLFPAAGPGPTWTTQRCESPAPQTPLAAWDVNPAGADLTACPLILWEKVPIRPLPEHRSTHGPISPGSWKQTGAGAPFPWPTCNLLLFLTDLLPGGRQPERDGEDEGAVPARHRAEAEEPDQPHPLPGQHLRLQRRGRRAQERPQAGAHPSGR